MKQKIVGIISGLLTLCMCGAVFSAVGEPVTMESLLNEMVDRTEIARFPEPAFRALEFTSYDRDSISPTESGWFDNVDRYEYMRTEVNHGRTEYVLMDHQAPGAIVRSWMPDQKLATPSILRVYLDGSDIPAIEGDMIEMFNGTGLIRPPFAHPSLLSAVSFFPIPYAHSCKVTVDQKPFYYIFNCREYPKGTAVESFTMADFNDVSDLIEQVGQALLNPSMNLPPATAHWSGTVATDAEVTLPLPAGPSAVCKFTVMLESTPTDQMMRSVIVRAEFDGQETIWCPLGDFFGSGVGLHPFEGWYRTVDANGTLSCRWVMPYQASGTLSLLNLYGESVDVTMFAATESWTWDGNSMYFHAGWRSEYPVPTRPYSDWNYITLTNGRGVYVGDTLTIYNPVSGWWGEGDHKIWVDGESFPSLFGTGTEDYYGYSWGGKSTDFYEHPFHAQVRAYRYDKLNRKTTTERNTQGYNTETRSRSLDTIPFHRSLQLDMEVWSGTDCNMEYTVGAYWYADANTISNLGPAPADAVRPVIGSEPVVDSNATSLDSIAGAYTLSNAPVSLPPGWAYLYSNAANGGTEVALTANTAIGNGGNTGFGGPAMFSTPAVLGTAISANEFEIFVDGFAGHAGAIGTDLLLHPGNTADTRFVVVRYTVSEADIANGNKADIVGSFRDLAGGTTGGGASSITADIFINATNLFSATGAAGRLFQADGTFDLTDVTVAAGDTISFVVGNNGGFGGDETALQGTISF